MYFCCRRLSAFYMKNLGPRQTGREMEEAMSCGKACSVEFEYSWRGYCPADALVLCHLIVRLHLSPYYIYIEVWIAGMSCAFEGNEGTVQLGQNPICKSNSKHVSTFDTVF